MTGENNKKCEEEVVAETVFTFCAVVAVPTLPIKVPKKLVAVIAVPVTLPLKTPAVSTLVPGLYDKSVSVDVAKPLPDNAGEKVI